MNNSQTDQKLNIRLATPADAQAILDIYAPYVRNTTLTFDSTVPTIEAFTDKVRKILDMYPFLVSTCDDKVVGFAYAVESRTRDAYKWNVELSIYLDENYHRRGIATALYTALFQILRTQGFVNMYAVIALPNEASVALHRRFGFNQVGVFESTGFKFGRWLDIIWMHHRIDGALNPAVHGLPTPIGEVHKSEIDTALNLATALLKGGG